MIITLCGSARFEPWFHAWNEALSLAGHCVFGLASYPSQHAGEKNWYTKEQKENLDDVHTDKIEASEGVVILNVFAYLGESTLREIRYARRRGKTLFSLESWGEGCGLRGNHFESVRAAARGFRVPDSFGSPIDTSHRHGRWNYPYDLLGDGGPYRSAIVEMLKTRLNPLAGLYDG